MGGGGGGVLCSSLSSGSSTIYFGTVQPSGLYEGIVPGCRWSLRNVSLYVGISVRIMHI